MLVTSLEKTGSDIAKGRTESPGMSALDNFNFCGIQYDIASLNLTVFSDPLQKYHEIFLKSVKIWGKSAYYFNEANWCKLYKRELFDKIRFPINRYAQDVAVVGDLLIQAKKVVDVEAVIYFWIQHTESVTHDKDKRRNFKFLEDNIFAGVAGFNVAIENGIVPFRSYFILETTLRDIKKLGGNHSELIQHIEKEYLDNMPHKMKAILFNIIGRVEYFFYAKIVSEKK